MGIPIKQILNKTTVNERNKFIIKLRGEGLKYKEIASQVGLTSGAVGTLIREKLAKETVRPVEVELKEPIEDFGLFLTCPQCSKPLKRVRWNRDRDMAVCNNFDCLFYRRPQSTIAKDKPWRKEGYVL